MSEDTMQLEEVNQPSSTNEKTSQPDEWSTLDGKSQDRFQALANLKKKAEDEATVERDKVTRLEKDLKSLRESTTKVPMPQTTNNEMTADEKTAYNRLTQLGVADQSYVDRKVSEKLKVIEDRLYFDRLHEKLEGEVSSKKGMPKYDRDEVEGYMREKQIYDPRAAYRDLYHDEILANEASKISKTKTVQTESTKSRIGTSEPWTKESLAERLRQPDGTEFFRKNKEKIMRMQGSLE